jgi:hypothetical protein
VPKKGRKKTLTLGQVGIGCSHCRYSETKLKGCTYFPSSISGIYNATMIIQQRHFPVCPSVSKEIHAEYNKLKVLTARSAYTKEYWVWAAKKLVSVVEDIIMLSLFVLLSLSHNSVIANDLSRASSIQMRVFSFAQMSTRRQIIMLFILRLFRPRSCFPWLSLRTRSLRPNTLFLS